MSVLTLKKQISDYMGQYITIEYSFTNQHGTLLGNSDESGVFSFCVGNEDTIPGLEQYVVGHKLGTELEFIIPAFEAYGEYDPNLVNHVSKSVLPSSIQFSLGQQLTINNTRVTVTEITDTDITTDKNHALAGMDLHFKVKIIDIGDKAPAQSACGCGGSCGCKS